MNPVVNDVRTGLTCISGLVDTWLNVASQLSMVGAPGVQQAGTKSVADPNNAGGTTAAMETNTYLGTSASRYPKARVWRTVH